MEEIQLAYNMSFFVKSIKYQMLANTDFKLSTQEQYIKQTEQEDKENKQTTKQIERKKHVRGEGWK